MSPVLQESHWVLSKKVVVSVPGTKHSCDARCRIAYSNDPERGSISLSIKAALANSTDRSDSLTLNICPKAVRNSSLVKRSKPNLCPSELSSKIRQTISGATDVSTLSIHLARPGIVLCPSWAKSLSSSDPEDSNFIAFAHICQSESLRLHFALVQFQGGEFETLRKFCSKIQTLQPESFDHHRRGVVERDPSIFQLSPPPYDEEHVSTPAEQADPPQYNDQPELNPVIGKRDRGWSLSPEEGCKRPLLTQPDWLGAPTEVNTPSTCSPSPSSNSIRPTHFIHASSPDDTDHVLLRYLEQKLSRLSEDRVRELLIRSGHHRLLGLSGDVDGGLPSKPGISGPPGVHLIDPYIKRYIDEEIHNSLKLQQDIVRDSIKAELDDIVQDSIRSELPGLVDHFREEIADEHKIKVCELGEVVQDSVCEIQTVTNDGSEVIGDVTTAHIDELDKQAVEAKKALKEMALKLTASLRASFDDLRGSRHEKQGTHTRCRSV
ncbi:hypothetical protein BO82DRAFT_356703 [Aspergillus uvarum CBS 121591]|uniref:Uncharacterized protein n=1 Tax=Aspergillus uvarum CBS 121591 TaxID=1448315 RepID=A0A319CKD2_9EURO|nr:hypothetical protein BO82DRAFT_356703 [Aspergillus uvarum CBS 121591]PYH79113.1 hypothetical protein BO82DRAFT_356703 [Aspergillus uvarum CBS 121591]